MISAIALVVWMVVGALLFAFLSPTKAFILNYVIGLLLLPVEMGIGGGQGSIVFTMAVRIDKYTACNLAGLAGTILFCPEVLRRFKWGLMETIFSAILLGVFITSVNNGLGAKDGTSNIINLVRIFAPVIFLAKVHITNLNELYVCLRTIIAGGVLYAFLSMAEFRLSPQTHRLLYGYFQHSFDQFARYSHYRPVGMLRHAIELSFFMGMTALGGVWLTRRKMFPPLWGWLPAWACTLLLVLGLAVTLTFSGYAAFGFGMLAMLLLAATKQRWVLWLLPAIAITWMAGRYVGFIDPTFLVDRIRQIDNARAESLSYRIEAEDIHLQTSRDYFVFGRGTQLGVMRTKDGRLVKAVDAFWLIYATFYGIYGLLGWLALWSAGIWAAWRIWFLAQQPMPPPWIGRQNEVRWLASLIAVMLGINLLDFLINAFPSPLLLVLNAGLVSVWEHWPSIRDIRRMTPRAETISEDMTPVGE